MQYFNVAALFKYCLGVLLQDIYLLVTNTDNSYTIVNITELKFYNSVKY